MSLILKEIVKLENNHTNCSICILGLVAHSGEDANEILRKYVLLDSILNLFKGTAKPKLTF